MSSTEEIVTHLQNGSFIFYKTWLMNIIHMGKYCRNKQLERYKLGFSTMFTTTTNSYNGREASDSRAQRGDEAKAHSFSGPVVLMLEASQHSVPHILQQHTPQEHAHVLYCCCDGLLQ